MIDRVEISIIEEQQPRWLSFLNRQQDFMERLAAEFVPIAVPNGKLAPNLAKQHIQVFRSLASDVTLTVYNMDDPVIGGYTPDKVALRRALNLASDTDKEIRLARKGQAIPAQSALMPNTFGYDPALQERKLRVQPGEGQGAARHVRLRRQGRRRLARPARRRAARDRMRHPARPAVAPARRTASQGHGQPRREGRRSSRPSGPRT